MIKSESTVNRSYCVVFQYDKKLPIMYDGNVIICDVNNKTFQEIFEEVSEQAYIKFRKFLPDNYELPKIIDIKPGSLIFIPDDNFKNE